MSENYRKDVDVYSEHCMPEMDGNTKKVFRPNSMRQVSAVKELNRLRNKLCLVEEEVSFRKYCTCPYACLRCAILDIVK